MYCVWILLYFLLYIQTKSLDVPTCQWHTHGTPLKVQAVGGCAYGNIQNVGQVYNAYDCISATELRIALYGDSSCSTPVYTIAIFNQTHISPELNFDCSLPECTNNIAKYENHFDYNDCSYYSEVFFLTDLCLQTKEDILENPPTPPQYYIAKVFNDSTLSESFDGESIYYSDEDCTTQISCKRWNQEGLTYPHCGITNALKSYTDTPEVNATCKTKTITYDPAQFNDIGCAYEYEGDWLRAIKICDTYRSRGYCLDWTIKCSDDGSYVAYNVYDSGDGSCNGNLLGEQIITYDTSLFNCSLPVCEDILKFRRYEIPDCGGRDCGEPNCNLDEADYSIYNMVKDGCFPDYNDTYLMMEEYVVDTMYIATCEETAGTPNATRYGYNAEDQTCSSNDPAFFGYFSSYNYCDLNNNGMYPNDTDQYFEVVGCSYDSFTSSSRTTCNMMNDFSDINCNWMYDGIDVHALDICDTIRSDQSYYDRQTKCNDNMTMVSTYYYDSNDGSCSGNEVYVSFKTDYTPHFQCGLSECTENIAKLRDYGNCSLDVADYSTNNIITDICIYFFQINVNWLTYCDGDIAAKYFYNDTDSTCSNAMLPFSIDLNPAICENGEDEYYQLLECIQPTPAPITEQPTMIPSESPSKTPSETPSMMPIEDTTSTPIFSTFETTESFDFETSELVLDGTDKASILSVINLILFCFLHFLMA